MTYAFIAKLSITLLAVPVITLAAADETEPSAILNEAEHQAYSGEVDRHHSLAITEVLEQGRDAVSDLIQDPADRGVSGPSCHFDVTAIKGNRAWFYFDVSYTKPNHNLPQSMVDSELHERYGSFSKSHKDAARRKLTENHGAAWRSWEFFAFGVSEKQIPLKQGDFAMEQGASPNDVLTGSYEQGVLTIQNESVLTKGGKICSVLKAEMDPTITEIGRFRFKRSAPVPENKNCSDVAWVQEVTCE